MSEITALREMRPAPEAEELDAMRMAARARFVAGTGPRTARQRPWLPVLAGGLIASVAASVTAALVLTNGPAAAPAQLGAAGHTRTVVTAAWTVREDADGTVTIYLQQYADPAGLQQTLLADGVNAIVRSIPYVVQTSFKGKVAVPTCDYDTTGRAPLAVQQAVWSIASGIPPQVFIIHPGAMPQGSALFLAFMANAPLNTGDTGNMATKPVVLDNDTVPACVPATNSARPLGPRGRSS
jgi:hypothetical protein